MFCRKCGKEIQDDSIFCSSEKIIGNSNEIKYVVSFPTASSILGGEPVENIILNKIMETEPGSYKG